jgi:hypothetical protein
MGVAKRTALSLFHESGVERSLNIRHYFIVLHLDIHLHSLSPRRQKAIMILYTGFQGGQPDLKQRRAVISDGNRFPRKMNP